MGYAWEPDPGILPVSSEASLSTGRWLSPPLCFHVHTGARRCQCDPNTRMQHPAAGPNSGWPLTPRRAV